MDDLSVDLPHDLLAEARNHISGTDTHLVFAKAEKVLKDLFSYGICLYYPPEVLAAASLYIGSEITQVDLMSCKISGPGDMDSKVSTKCTNREGEDSVTDFDVTLGKRSSPGCVDGFEVEIFGARAAMKKISGQNLVSSKILDVKSFFDNELESTDTKNPNYNAIFAETKNIEIETTPEVRTDIFALAKSPIDGVSNFVIYEPKLEAVPTNSETSSSWLYNSANKTPCNRDFDPMSIIGNEANRNEKAFDVNNCINSASQSILDSDTFLHNFFTDSSSDQEMCSEKGDCQVDPSNPSEEPKFSVSPDFTLGNKKLSTASDCNIKKTPFLWYRI